MNLPEGQRGRLVALGLLLILLIGVFEIALQPAWQNYSGLLEQIDDSRFELQRYQRIAADLPALREQQQALQVQQPLQPHLLSGENRALAGAGLQRHLQDLVGRHGGRVLSARALRPESDGALERIALNSRFQIDLDGLQKVIHELENGRPLLSISQLQITVLQTHRRQTVGNIDVRLTLSGLRPADQEESGRG